MRLAVSNIAWEKHDDPRMLAFLSSQGVEGVEVAPTKIWPGWEGASEAAAREYGKMLEGEGFVVPALQALLFDKPWLQVFDPATHDEFLEHVALVADMARGFDARVLVFGSPGNRRRGDLSPAKSMEIATAFFRRAAGVCSERGAVLGLGAQSPGVRLRLRDRRGAGQGARGSGGSPGLRAAFGRRRDPHGRRGPS